MKLYAFPHNILILGCGAVSQCFQSLLMRHIEMPFSKITIIDQKPFHHFADNPLVKAGAIYIQKEITKENYASVLTNYVKPGDIIIDLAVAIDTSDLLDWCHHNNICFLNSSIESWPEYYQKPKENSLYNYYTKLFAQVKQWPPQSATTILEHGANPGLVNHWSKLGLEDIAKKIIEITSDNALRNQLEQALENNNYAKLCYLTQTKVIHIAERDSQIINNPKKINEFVNTWSIIAFFEEFMALAEMTWGTHEKTFPKNAQKFNVGPQHQIQFNERCVNILLQTWVPSGPINGMLVRHGEVYTIGDYLSYFENNRLLHRPSIGFIYLPSDGALCSLFESKMNNYTLQHAKRIVKNEIVYGSDELGILLMGHPLNSWWIGSELTIEQTRRHVENENATVLQVASSLLAAFLWMIKNPKAGFHIPDTLPSREIIAIAEPYLGTVTSKQISWNPNYKKSTQEITENAWQFANFIAD